MSADPVDIEDVEHVASLARIALADSEREQFVDEFAEILAWFAALDDVPDIEESTELNNVLRADELRESLSQEEALANAVRTEDGFFEGPPVG